MNSDDFGEERYAANLDSLLLESQVMLKDPIVASSFVPRADDPMKMSRLDLIATLFRQGFTESVLMLPPLTEGDDLRLFTKMAWRGPKGYLICLARRNDIWPKGCTGIYHDMPASYYTALLMCNNLEAVDRSMLEGWASNAYFKSLVSDQTGQNEDQAETIARDPDSPEHLAIVEAARSQVCQSSKAVHALDAESRPVVVKLRDMDVVINFDNFSHASGVQRAYTRCIWGHQRCFRYRQVSIDSDRQSLLAYLLAWQASGALGLDREAHQALQPDPGLIERARLRLLPE